MFLLSKPTSFDSGGVSKRKQVASMSGGKYDSIVADMINIGSTGN